MLRFGAISVNTVPAPPCKARVSLHYGVEDINEDDVVRPPFHSARLSSDGMDIVYADVVQLAKASEPMHRVQPTSVAATSSGATCEGGGLVTSDEESEDDRSHHGTRFAHRSSNKIGRRPEKRHRVNPPAYLTRPPEGKPTHLFPEGPHEGIQISSLAGSQDQG